MSVLRKVSTDDPPHTTTSPAAMWTRNNVNPCQFECLNFRVQTAFSGVFDAFFIAEADASGNLLRRKARKCRSVVHRAKKTPEDAQNHPD
jgi:hypothetical protein